ncbi:DUF5677 domain-containing protein [Kribbella sp. NPDC050241]|uniref:DUF5677 domain-containing protein n=1 Tax=Kribbella sp. NPDC050241 TaxID=3364115 RepID=UPI0037A7F5A3
MSKKNRNRSRAARQNTSLRQHKQVGKTLSPPLQTLDMTQVPWLRDTFPDLIWVGMLVSEHGTHGMHLVRRTLDRARRVLDEANAAPGLVLTGQLTSFERVPSEFQTAVLDALKADDLYEEAFPWTFVRAMSKYPTMPGRWLLDGWLGREEVVAADLPEKLLARTIRNQSHGQSPIATRVKFMVLTAFAAAGKMKFARGVMDDLLEAFPRYPDQITEEERRRVEPSIRSMFLMFSPGAPGEQSNDGAPLQWAKDFWRTNWSLYQCLPEHSPHPLADQEAEESRTAIAQAREAWSTELDQLMDEVRNLAAETDPDLYQPDRHEVLTGITYHVLRSLEAMISYPGLWTMEHASGFIRGIIDARITLKWLVLKDDLALYEKFKAYGRGRLKLLKLHLEEYRDGLAEAPDDLDSAIEYLDALVNRDIWEEFQDISIQGSFSGIDTRKMAEQVGLLHEYRFVFAPSSANVHGEWSALDRFALTVCGNPLHRQHRIPRPKDDPKLLGPELVDSALGHAQNLVDDYREAMTRGNSLADNP